MSMWDDEAGYDLSDPKHPSWRDRMSSVYDNRDKTVQPITCEFEDIDESGGVKDAA